MFRVKGPASRSHPRARKTLPRKTASRFRRAASSRALAPVYSLRTVGTNPIGTHIFNITAWTPLLTTSAGSYSASVALNFPGYYYTSSTWATMPNQMGSRARLFALFDEYRVISLTTKMVIPSLNNGFVQTADTNDNFMYTYMDVDDYINSSEAFMLDAGVAPRCYNGAVSTVGDCTTVMKNYSDPGRLRQYINCSLVGTSPLATSYTASGTVPINAYGSIKHLWPNLLATQYYGRLYATWRVVFRGLTLQ
jgi:hypothetical protein